MDLYYRESEIKLLRRQLWMSRQQHSRMSLVSGRKEAGKTSLAAAALEGETFLYFRMDGPAEALMLEEFIDQVRNKYDLFVPSRVVNIETFLEFLFDIAHKRPISIVLDSLDGYLSSRPDFAPFLRELWDGNKIGTHVNLILILENNSLVYNLFDGEDSPLLNSPDVRVQVRYFTPSQLKGLLLAAAPERSSEDLLALYMCTGGLPSLVMDALRKTDATRDAIFSFFISPSSPLHLAAISRLFGTVGKNSGIYLSILSLIASGIKSQPEMEERLGGVVTGGYLARLETDYQLITKVRPMLGAQQSRNVVRYEVADSYMLFWLKYLYFGRNTVQLGLYPDILSQALADFPVSGRQALARYFVNKFSEENATLNIGGDWPPLRLSRTPSKKKDYRIARKKPVRTPVPSASGQHEIDIIAIDEKKKKALVADVCLDASGFEKGPFLERLSVLKKGPLSGYIIDSRIFTLVDM